MVFKSIRAGVAGAVRHPGLTLITWLWNLALAATLALPAFAIFSSALAHSREAGRTLDEFNVSVFLDIFHYDRTSAASAFAVAVVGLALAALIGGALVGAGVVATLVSDNPAAATTDGPGAASAMLLSRRSFLGRFFGRAGHLFGRYVRLLTVTVVAVGIAHTVVSFVSAPLLSMVAGSSWEPGWMVATAANGLLLGAVAGFCTLTFDYARIRIAATDQRSTLTAWYHGCRYVLRRPVAIVTVGLVFALALAALLGISVLVQASLSSATRLSIASLIAVQQCTMLLRAGARVAQLAAEVDFARRATGLFPAADVAPQPFPF